MMEAEHEHDWRPIHHPFNEGLWARCEICGDIVDVDLVLKQAQKGELECPTETPEKSNGGESETVESFPSYLSPGNYLKVLNDKDFQSL